MISILTPIFFLGINQNEYYSCDAKYRNWLKIELANAEVSPHELSADEKHREVTAAKEALSSSLLLLESKLFYSVNKHCEDIILVLIRI